MLRRGNRGIACAIGHASGVQINRQIAFGIGGGRHGQGIGVAAAGQADDRPVADAERPLGQAAHRLRESHGKDNVTTCNIRRTGLVVGNGNGGRASVDRHGQRSRVDAAVARGIHSADSNEVLSVRQRAGGYLHKQITRLNRMSPNYRVAIAGIHQLNHFAHGNA